MDLLIGIDGGGSKTNCLLSDKGMKILSKSAGGPTNFLAIGMDKAVDNAVEVIRKSFNLIDVKNSKLVSVVIATAGAGRKNDAFEFGYRVKDKFKNIITVEEINVVTDAEAALEGALDGEEGVVVICGTGSIVFAKDKLGEHFRSGGLGKILGDEGSGHSLGLKGLSLVSKELDGQKINTKLTSHVMSRYKIADIHQLINHVYKGAPEYSEIGIEVINCASEGDSACLNLIDSEICELVNQVEAVSVKINKDDFKISLLGGLIENHTFYKGLIKKKLIESFSNIQVIEPINKPEYGALIIAQKAILNSNAKN
ncbi:MAG: BadF/BadG/BcrA/BcrD ATPase family protein [Melioribacteraceae bacterium]